MNDLMHIRLLPYLLAVLLAGCCCERQSDVVDSFRQEHPHEFKQYIYIYPISLDTYYWSEGDKDSTVGSLIRELQRFKNVPELEGFAKKKHQEAVDDWRTTIGRYTHLEKCSADGGSICQFKWSDGTNTQIGLMVLKNGNVVTRDVWVSEYGPVSTNKIDQ